MKRSISGLLLAFCILLTHLNAAEPTKKISNFTLEDYNGFKHSLTDYSASKAIVVIFISTQCPVSNAYNERMVQLNKDFSGKGIVFIGINSNKQESVLEMKEHAKNNGFLFPILKDHNNIIANAFSSSVTPEVFVLNPKLDVLYHGRIDDSRRISEVRSEDLRSALEAILAGKSIAVRETKAFGCTIKRIQ
jgi:peroxiredoxin